ncbi:unnamed protein product, partial [Haemonchus placei]|uniref:Lysosomal acid phosphatase n=1 Tax=Haemonchus placei TaxID=6290 RepID=A0A0N4X5V1_HAEPC
MLALGYLLLLHLLVYTAAQNPLSTLQFVAFWFRHGERTPTHYMYFPKEIPPLIRYTEAEPGELTNRGIQQAYQRGQFIRTHYDSFLGLVYRPSELIMNNTQLPYPRWAEPLRANVSLYRNIFHQRMIDAQSETAGRYHSEMLLSFIEDHLNRPLMARNKAVFISGHDSNFMALGRQLNITQIANEMLPFAALLTVELHVINGTNFVELWLSPTLTEELVRVDIPQCPNPCRLETLQNVLKDRRLSKPSWEAQCLGLEANAYDGIVT